MVADQPNAGRTQPPDTVDESAMDGNVLAGPLAEVFGVDVTAAVMTCAGCGRRQVVAELVVYQGGMGSTARCRGCGEVMLRLTRLRAEVVLDLTGASTMRIPLPNEGS